MLEHTLYVQKTVHRRVQTLVVVVVVVVLHIIE
jgi:hypothetical protein